MALLCLALLLGASVCQAAWFPRQAPAPAPPVQQTPACSPQFIFLTITHTVTDTPPTVTIAQVDSSAIGRELSSKASVDTVQVTQKDPLAPIVPSTVSIQPVPTTHYFTHDIIVPGFEATEAPNNGESVYYVSAAKSTTQWGVSPSGVDKVTIGATTVTVSPIPKSTLPAPPPPPPAPPAALKPPHILDQNSGNDTADSTVDSAASAENTEVMATTSVTSFITTVTSSVTVEVTIAPSWADYSETRSEEYENIQKRQTCTLISASIGDRWVSWCNNWDGSTTLSYTTWETTTSAANIPQSGVIESTTTPPVTLSTGTALNPPPGPTPQACGEVGSFAIDFEDVPVFSTVDNNTTLAPPMPNPWPTRKYFTWARGWDYGPPPSGPYPPQQGERLGHYEPSNSNLDTGATNAGVYSGGAFGVYNLASNEAYWFKAHSLWVGCDNGATNPQIDCDFVATGYQWNEAQQREVVVATQHLHIPPCANFQNCRLAQMNLDPRFTSLTSLSFYANVQGRLRGFWIDAIELDWNNNSCEAGLARIRPGKA